MVSEGKQQPPGRARQLIAIIATVALVIVVWKFIDYRMQPPPPPQQPAQAQSSGPPQRR